MNVLVPEGTKYVMYATEKRIGLDTMILEPNFIQHTVTVEPCSCMDRL